MFALYPIFIVAIHKIARIDASPDVRCDPSQIQTQTRTVGRAVQHFDAVDATHRPSGIVTPSVMDLSRGLQQNAL